MSRHKRLRKLLGILFAGIGGALILFILQHIFPNHPTEAPEAKIEVSDWEGTAPLKVTFNAMGSSDDKGVDGLHYQWYLDGSILSDRVRFDHTFVDYGKHTVTLRVTDSDGLSDRDYVYIEVIQTQRSSSVSDGANEQGSMQIDHEVRLSGLDMNVTDDGPPKEIVADFPQDLDVTGISISITFSDDLWDPGESWHLESVGGQRNLTANSKGSTKLRIPSLNRHIAGQFKEGRFVGFLRAENGSFRVEEIVLLLVGVRRTEGGPN